MVKNLEHILGSCLIFRLLLLLVFILPLSGQDSTKIIRDQDSLTFYPGRPLIMSLIVPGLGQLYNQEPVWKPSLFIGTEILSLASIFYANKRGI